MESRTDAIEALYQEGVAARAAGQPKCPYSSDTYQEFYWKRGYRDAENPPPEGVIPVLAEYSPRASMQDKSMDPEVTLRTSAGVVLVRLYMSPGKARLTTKELNDLGAHIERVLTENPFNLESRLIDSAPPRWLANGSKDASTPTRTPRAARVVDGVVRVPAGAKVGPDGEIVVPSRTLDTSSPNAKTFRRACRSARNAIRILAEEQGRPVSVVTKEMMEKS